MSEEKKVTAVSTGGGVAPGRGDITDLLEWRQRTKGHRSVPSLTAAAAREMLGRFTRKEKEAVLLGFLLSDSVPEEQLNAMIEVVMGFGGGAERGG